MIENSSSHIAWFCGRRSCRAVSPIIATILLVAITTVIAAVLYVTVSGYLHQSINPPIVIGWETVQVQSHAGSEFWYNTSVASVTPSNLHWIDISAISLKTSSGGPYQGGVINISVSSVGGGALNYIQGAGWSFTGGASSQTLVNGGDSFMVETQLSLAGGTVVFSPDSSFSGTSVIDIPT